MASAMVRYMVDDLEQAVAFYTERLGFTVDMEVPGGFAMLSRGPLRLFLNVTGGPGGAAQPMPDGRVPEPGGWSRFVLQFDDLDAAVAELREAGAAFRNDIVEGRGGRQILLEDPSGNAVELFEPASG